MAELADILMGILDRLEQAEAHIAALQKADTSRAAEARGDAAATTQYLARMAPAANDHDLTS